MKKLGAILLVVALILALGMVPAIPVGASPAPAIAGLWHLDSNANDTSGNGNNGTLIGNAYIGPTGYFSEDTLNLDGNGDYVSVADSASLDISDVMTVEAWVYLTGYTSGKVYTVVGKWDDLGSANDRGYLLAISTKEDGNPYPKFYISTNGADFPSAKSPEALSLNTWYHLVGTFDGQYIRIYVGEMEKASNDLGSATIATNNEPLLIGGNTAGGSGGNAYFNGLIDEVRIWHSQRPDFEVSATPDEAYNLIGTEHEITATVDPVAPGAVVHLEVISGPNMGTTDTGSDSTGNDGMVTLSYTSGSAAGMDTIIVWVDLNWNGLYDEGIDHFTTVVKHWFGSGFLTGGGNIKTVTTNPKGKSIEQLAWTFGGNVGYLEDGTIVGQFEIVDHTGKGAVSWHCNNDFDSLIFWGDPTDSPPANVDHARFVGTFTSNKDDSKYLRVTIWDDQEPGRDYDEIKVEYWDGDSWEPWFSGEPISGGNLQVHKGATSMVPDNGGVS